MLDHQEEQDRQTAKGTSRLQQGSSKNNATSFTIISLKLQTRSSTMSGKKKRGKGR